MCSRPIVTLRNCSMSRHRRRTRRNHAPLTARPFRLVLEALECRTLPSVTFFSDVANPGKNIVQFTEDVSGASDTLLLSPSNGGQLQYQLNGAALSTDLNTALAGTQPLSLSAISRIDVLLGNGNNLLDVDGTANPGIFPSPSGIVFTTDGGTDTLIVRENANITLNSAGVTTSTGGTVSFSSVELAQLIGGDSNNVVGASAVAGHMPRAAA